MEPTEDQLRDAWRAIAGPDWGDYDQAKKAATHWALVRLRASLVARGVRVDAQPAAVHTPPAETAPPAPAAAPPPHWGSLRQPHGPTFDRKRAAAGERDDD